MASTSTETFQTKQAPRTGWGSETQAEPGLLIEDHALLGDLHTAALVARDGSIDFLCLPDFDSDACFTSLLGTPENGRWKLAPKTPVREVRRRYRGKSLILETEFVTESGTVRVVDFMPIRKEGPHVVRWVEGVRGTVTMRSELRPRFANGFTVPLVSRRDGSSAAVAGPDALYLRGGAGEAPPPFESEFTVQAGQRIPFVLSWARPYAEIPAPLDPEVALREAQDFWEDWASRIQLPAEYQDVVVRSLLTLKACSFRPSGALVAAPTFGLPETPGGDRNWDYRFCWIRDSVLTLNALMRADLMDEASAFADWLENAIGGAPGQLQIMYGIRGERRLTEVSLDWLGGYEGARPVRIGNGAYSQFQLDVLGEFAAALYIHAKLLGRLPARGEKALKTLATRVSEVWMEPDHGIWEMRGPEHSFTASKVSAWVVIDRWLSAIDEFGLKEDKAPWVELRQTIFDEVCSKGYDAQRNTFTQYYGSKAVDASLLAIPMSGFLPPGDPRVAGTVRAIEQELMPEGLVLRYRTEDSVDGLSGEEGAFLACSFWLADTYQLMGRTEDARKLFAKLVGLCNDVGLLAEEYLPRERRQLGNFPQAFSHLALVNCAYMLFEGHKPAMRS
ncbi:glycoside hydrolase family 15 protein [Corallococcus praedator]|uniref:Glycoside hydrolase family 15 protein n=1 Tax=Corallococcus praedator TaxID=2316724 RepID=A0ABX9QJZ4_9BACT|nr:MULTISPECIES: glycoside hydrolase family 15 protein [Corallococcus]RKH17721.1 glycoside hydrolase family 15 protein [Corallococcus sp. CA047B]RKH31642.1 glycoside hydrolase family 15 protein [Corallococcus sp. CA031C]RKI10730.1 glycoside hydrolase family 15 protein [Corallococcus praedator]